MSTVPNPCRICVFCGSSSGGDPAYLDAALDLGRRIAAAGMGLVYGGASIGLMGAVADAGLAGGAEVIGVIPSVLKDREIAHSGLAQLHFVETMHERKALMAHYADAFVALPGGFGTLDEFFEILTWAQLKIHAKPCLLVNTQGYYDGLLRFLDHAVEAGFLKQDNRLLVQVAADPRQAIEIARQLFEQRPQEQRPAPDAALNQLVR